ncbi:MAG: hypothetical protein KBD19_04465 [Candidatus Moranbacteria bacterium]|nr:hypothetical protein [Candidatus Moranbacteria bacterium]
MRERIGRKIEEIRQKPEHVRVWYAWVGVLVAMFFVVLIWIFTLQENLSRSNPGEDVKKIQGKIPIGKPLEEVKSLDEIFGEQNTSKDMKTEVR